MPDKQPPKENQFKPGESGNPGGRPKSKPWADAYREYGGMTIPQLQIAPTDTVIQACVKKIYQTLLQDPQTRLAREAADRTDGRVPLPLIGSTDEPIAITIVSNVPRPDRTQKPKPPKKKHARNVN